VSSFIQNKDYIDIIIHKDSFINRWIVFGLGWSNSKTFTFINVKYTIAQIVD